MLLKMLLSDFSKKVITSKSVQMVNWILLQELTVKEPIGRYEIKHLMILETSKAPWKLFFCVEPVANQQS